MLINILGVNIEKDYTIENVLEKIKKTIENKKKLFIATINPEFIMNARTDQEFRNILNKADLPLADGFGLKCAAFYQGKKLNVIPGSDLMPKICELAEKYSYKIFLLGGYNYTAKMVAIKLKNKFPKLQIVGAEEGMSKEKFRMENGELIKRINTANPDILFVAFGGSVKQEKWIYYNMAKLKKPMVAMGIGGTFDYLAGIVKRAPLAFRAAGLEWLYRLIQQPKRAKRIYTAVIKFPLAVVFSRKKL